MCLETDQPKEESKGVSDIELDQEVLDYLHNIILCEEYTQKRNFVLIGNRPKCTS